MRFFANFRENSIIDTHALSPLWWKVCVFLFFLGGISMFVMSLLFVTRPLHASGPSSNQLLNYQARLTDNNGIPLPDGAKNVKFVIYDALSGGNCEYTARGTCGTPTAKSVTVANGHFSTLFGEAGDVAMPAGLFSGDESRFLEIQVETSTPGTYETLSPRKRIVSGPFAMNANLLDDLDTSAVGGSAAFVPITDSSGNLTLTKDFSVSTFTIPGSAAPSVSSVDQGRIYFDSTSDKFRVSENGGAYADLIGASGTSGWTDDGSTVRLTTSSDSVGIGTTAPGTNTKLSVTGGAMTIDSSTTANTTANAMMHINGLFGTATRLIQAAALGTSKDAVLMLASTSGASANQWWTTGVTSGNIWRIQPGIEFFGSIGLSIDSSGNVGIGTTGPNGLLHLNSATVNKELLVLRNTNTTASASVPVFLASNSGGSLTNVNIENTGAGAFTVRTGATTEMGYGTARLTILSGGNVGIGSASPAHLLDVAGTIRTKASPDGQLLIDADATGNPWVGFYQNGTRRAFIQYPNSISGLSFSVAEAFRMTILSGGNVGVGDTTPASLFTVGSGDLFQVNSSGDLVKIDNVTYNWPASQGAASTSLVNDGSGNLSWSVAGPSSGGGWTDDGTVVRLTTVTDNVGIGTTSVVSDKLYVSGGSLRVQSGGSGGTGTINLGFGAQSIILTDESTGSFRIRNYDGGGATYREVFFSNISGNVGIGTTSPTARLHVSGGSLRVETGGSGGTGTIALGHGSQSLIDTDETASTFRIRNYDGPDTVYREILFANQDGLVGFGTTSPGAKVDAFSSTFPVVRGVRTSTGTTGTLLAYSAEQRTTADMVDAFGTGYGFEIRDSAGTSNNIADITAIREGADNSGTMAFATYSGGTRGVKMSILPSGNVGIGTTVPGSKLHVYGSAAAAGVTSSFTNTDATGFTTLYLGNDGGLAGVVQVIGSSYSDAAIRNDMEIVATSASGDLNAVVQGTGRSFNVMNLSRVARLTVLESGNVGIGTTGPNTILDINGALSVREMAAPALSPADQGRIYFDSTSNTFKVSQNGGAYTDLVSGASSGWTDDGTVVRLTTITDSVGIGTTSPAAPLQVSFARGTTTLNVNPTQMLTDSTAEAINVGPELLFHSTTVGGGAGLATIQGAKENATASNYASFLRFGTRVNGGAMTEQMRITSAGNVGIGTASSAARLSVVGPTGVTAEPVSIWDNANLGAGVGGALSFLGNTGPGNPSYSTLATIQGFKENATDSNYASAFRVYTRANGGAMTEQLRISSAGDVSIGTTSAAGGSGKQLTVTGTSTFARLNLQRTAAVTSGDLGIVDFWNGATGVAEIGSQSDGATDDGRLTFWTKATGGSLSERMRITSGGNVGIGTTAPGTINGVSGFASSLQVNRTGGAEVVIDGTTYSSILMNDSGASVNNRMWQFFANDGDLRIRQMLDSGAEDVDALTLTSSGTVGINDTSPDATLDVTGSSATVLSLARTAVSVGEWRGIITSDPVGSGDLYTAGSITLVGQTASTDFGIRAGSSGNPQFTLLDTGNVGIGTTAPGSNLHVHATAGNNVALKLSDADVSHPFTAVGFSPEVTANNFAQWANASGLGGGFQLNGFTDDDSLPAYIAGHIGVASPTATAVILDGWKTNGGTGRTALTGTEKVFQVSTGGSVLMTVQGNGNVGIGTTVPTGKLHVEDNTNTSADTNLLRLKSVFGNGGTKAISWSDATDEVGRIGLKYDGVSQVDFVIEDLYNSAYQTATRLFTVKGTGNVGIGTASPATALDLNGAFSVREMAAPALSPADQGRIYFDSTSNTFKVSQHGGAYVDLVSGASSGWTDDGTTVRLTTSTDSVGIGTASPSGKLHVHSATADAIKMTVSDMNAGAYILAQNTGNSATTALTSYGSAHAGTSSGISRAGLTEMSFDGNTAAILRNIANTPLYVSTNDTVRMTILAGGNVGIGTSTPVAGLELRRSTTDGSTAFVAAYNPSTATASYAGFNAKGNNGTVDVQFYADGLGTGALGTAGGYFGSASNHPIGLFTNNLERIRISANGDVGIGTTSAGAKLHVQKNIDGIAAVDIRNNTAGTGAEAGFFAYNDLSNFAELGIASSLTATYGATVANNAFLYTGAPGLVLMVDNASGIIKFATGGSTERVRIDNAGNFGIGSTSPATRLDVRQTAAASTAETLAQFTLSDATTGYLKVSNSSSGDTFFIPTLEGRGATSVESLVLTGNAASGHDTGSNALIQLNATINSGTAVATRPLLSVTNNGSANSKFIITAAGDAGIGTTSPTARLAVVGDSNSTAAMHVARYSSDTSASSILLRKSRGTAGVPVIVNSGDAIGTMNFTGHDGANFRSAASITAEVDGTPGTDDMPGRLVFYTAADGTFGGTEQMRITNAGNVGIGTTTVPARLTVSPTLTAVSGTDTTVAVSSVLTLTGASTLTSIDINPAIDGSNAVTLYRGIFVRPDFSVTSASSATVVGIEANPRIGSTGTYTDLYGLVANPEVGASATVGSVYGIQIDNSAVAGTVANNYGLYVANATGGTNDWAIYTAGGLNYHENSAATVAAFNRTTDDGTIISLQQAGVEEGTISVSGTTVSYNAFTGSHYAWTDEDIQMGALVIMTGDNKRLHGSENSEIMYGIAPTSTKNDAKVMGSYLALQEPNKPRDLDNPHLIMAVGNGEMWVSEEGGNVEAGDYLISSSTYGHAMKDDAASSTSYIVARAAEPIDWATVTEMVGGVKHKKISIFFESFTRKNDNLALTETKDLQTLTADLNVNGKLLLNVRGIIGLQWSISEEGKLVVNEIETKKVTAEEVVVKTTDAKQTIGVGTIPANADFVRVDNSIITSDTNVFATFKTDPGSSWWIAETGVGYFIVKTKQPVAAEAKFNYWLIGVDDQTSPPAEPPVVVALPSEEVVTEPGVEPIIEPISPESTSSEE